MMTQNYYAKSFQQKRYTLLFRDNFFPRMLVWYPAMYFLSMSVEWFLRMIQFSTWLLVFYQGSFGIICQRTNYKSQLITIISLHMHHISWHFPPFLIASSLHKVGMLFAESLFHRQTHLSLSLYNDHTFSQSLSYNIQMYCHFNARPNISQTKMLNIRNYCDNRSSLQESAKFKAFAKL